MTDLEYNMLGTGLPVCATLRKHWDKLVKIRIDGALKPNKGDDDSNDLTRLANLEPGKALAAIQSQEDIGVYGQSIEKIIETYQIPKNKRELLMNALEKCATVYVKMCVQKLSNQLIQDEFLRLFNISKQAKQLSENLDKLSNPDNVLAYFSQKAPQIFGDIDLQKLLADTQSDLLPLVDLEAKLRNSEYLQALRIGKPGRKRDWQLHMWVMFMLEIWVTVLGRIPNRSQDKMNGRQRFLDFMCDCMEPLHPDLEKDKLINVFNRIQKEA